MKKTLLQITELKNDIEKLLTVFPYYQIYISTLGGDHNASILFTICLDKKETWAHGIFENSRYLRFHLSNESKGLVLESFSGWKIPIKFRKLTNTEPAKHIQRIEKLIKELKDLNLLIANN